MELLHVIQVVASVYLLSGEDVTDLFLETAQESRVTADSNSGNNRKKREISDNNVINVPDDPIKLDESWKPPVRITFHDDYFLEATSPILIWDQLAVHIWQ